MKKAISTLVIVSIIGISGCSNNTTLPEISSNTTVNSSNIDLNNANLIPEINHSFINVKPEAESGEILVALRENAGSRANTIADRINKKYGTRTISSIPGISALLLESTTRQPVENVIEKINNSKDSDIQIAGPNYKVFATLDINDPMSTEQYALNKVEAKRAWDITQGDENTVIAIVDTGIDLNHPDLKDKIVSTGFSALKGEEGKPALDDNGHGTHCAGIAAGISNNGIGIAGMAPKNKILPVRVLGGQGSGSLFSIAKGIEWAGTHGAKVISMSLGGPSSMMDLVVERAVQKALKNDAVVVSAMGNSGKDEKMVPACIKGVIAVGATDENDKKASFSTWGDHISVSAPGVQILSTTPTYDVFLTTQYGISKNYAKLSGTSMACPAVSGIVGLLRSKFPNLTNTQVKEKIERSVDDLGEQGFDKLYGYGRINAFKAVSNDR